MSDGSLNEFWQEFKGGFLEVWNDPKCWFIYGGAGAILGIFIGWSLHD